ncbi:hypothetical protein SAXI111661_06485 [Saccharomonospora xinjiangensis]|uniref:hypothetical protein n=1 Tax=Saccharomonospora xinjiangensis TaxID=75294 RepID=UPI0010C4878B|nr:hypothetical protein [Saccharomonospora xinjiangensis]QBQ59521.1 hypothetical protein EYD13_05755 [Saccharomonospora xinjiangensis]
MSAVTSQPQTPSKANSVSAGPASDAKAFFTAALLTFACGMIALIGFVMAGVFGIILGIVGIVFGLVWWKEQHGGMLPRDLPGKSLVSLTVVSLVLFGLAALMA